MARIRRQAESDETRSSATAVATLDTGQTPVAQLKSSDYRVTKMKFAKVGARRRSLSQNVNNLWGLKV